MFTSHTVSTRFIGAKLLGGLVVAGLVLGFLAGCSGDQNEATQEESNGGTLADFQLGEPVTNSDVAVIVRVRGRTDTLSVSDLQSRVKTFAAQSPGTQLSPDQEQRLRVQAVDQYVNQTVLLTEASVQEVSVTDQDINSRLQQIQSRFPNDSTYRAFLDSENMTEEDLTDELRRNMRIQTLLGQISNELPEPTEEDIQSYREEQAEQVKAQHILLEVQRGAPEDTVQKVRDQAETILDSVQAGADFAALARRYSEDPGSASRGGTLSYFSKGQMVPEFEKAVFALSDSGQVADELVRTDYGFHIIRLLDRRTTDLMSKKQASQQLSQRRRTEEIRDILNKLRRETTVRVNEDVIDPAQL